MKLALGVVALIAITFDGIVPGRSAHADTNTVVIQARGNPNLVDFFALQEKRSNLRVNVVMKGLDVAFSEWLRYERPYQYRHYAGEVSNK